MAVMRGLVLLFLIFYGENAAAERCPFGWTPFGVQCFKFFPQTVDWVGAEKNCQSLDANLASVHSKAQNEFLFSLVPVDAHVWIGGHGGLGGHGGHGGEMEEQWLWTDGSPFDYTNWCENDIAFEDCLEINMSNNGCWNNVPCDVQLGYFCARNL